MGVVNLSGSGLQLDGTDRLGQLERLADLKQEGILTEAEFETERAKILPG